MRHTRGMYLEGILSEYMATKNAHVDSHVEGCDGTRLSATDSRNWKSKVGVVIIPGISVPRESYFRLFAELQDYHALVYDLRGQALSSGELDGKLCVDDVNHIGTVFKEMYELEHLVGIGHSYGGLALLQAAVQPIHPYSLRIALAPPLALKESSDRMPNHMTKLSAYLYNIKRAMERPALRDEIVRHYESFWPHAFFLDPHICALRIGNPSHYNTTREETPELIELLGQIHAPTALYFAGEDNRISYSNPSFDTACILSEMRHFPLKVLPHLSHRFNQEPEERFMLSYNNDVVLEEVTSLIADHVKRDGVR